MKSIKRMTKYKAKPTIVDGIRFASQKEARRYGELKLLERAGEISELKLQPEYPYPRDGHPVFKYKADFGYIDEKNRKYVIEDVKGVKTPVYKLKKKLIEHEYHITIAET